MGQQKYPHIINVYLGEKYYVVPSLLGMGGFYVNSENVFVLSREMDNTKMGKVILEAQNYIDKSPIDTRTPAERKESSTWKRYTNRGYLSFHNRHNCACIVKYEDGTMKISSLERNCGKKGGYGGEIKGCHLPAQATPEQLGEAVLDVLAAAEEFYRKK